MEILFTQVSLGRRTFGGAISSRCALALAVLPLLASTFSASAQRADAPRASFQSPEAIARFASPPAGTAAAAEESPASSWLAAAPPPAGIARYAFAQDGNNFYLLGGITSVGVVSSVRRYNAATDTWSTLNDLPRGSEAPAAAYYGGKIYLADGYPGENLIRIYDIASNSWTAGPPRVGVSHSFGAAAGAYGGKIFVVGGGNVGSPTLSIYDIATNTWSLGPAAPAPYLLGGYTQIGQYLYLVGGFGENEAVNSGTSMRFDMSTLSWSTGPAFTPRRADFALAAAGSKLFAIGGDLNGGTYFDEATQVDELETAQWNSGAWAVSPDALPIGRQANPGGFFTSVRLGGEIWSTGGYTGLTHSYRAEQIFRAAPAIITPPPPSPTPTATPSPTATPAPTATPTPTPVPTATPTPTPIPTATPTPTPVPTATPTPTATPAPTATPNPTPTPVPTATPDPTPIASLPIAPAGAVIVAAGPNESLDPGETVTVLLALQNTGASGNCAPTTLRGTLMPTGGAVSVAQAAKTFDRVCAAAPPVWRAYTFTVPPTLSCGSPAVLSLSLGDGAVGYGVVSYTLNTTSCAPTFTVTTIDDHNDGTCSASDCTLREAMNAANLNVGSAIVFAPQLTGTIQLNSSLPAISTAVAINGPGANRLTVRRSSSEAFRIFHILPTAVASVSGLTISNGATAGANGGGIYNAGQLRVNDCVVSGNSTGGNIFSLIGHGAGIYNEVGAVLDLQRCTFSGNTATQYGGAICNEGTLTATNCTLSGNIAARGGGIMSRYGNGLASTMLRNCTIARCSATSTLTGAKDGGGGVFSEGVAAQVNVANTIIALNSAPANPDVTGKFTSTGHNLVGQIGRGLGFIHGTNGDQVGNSETPLDPVLAPLSGNTAAVPTHALFPVSPAINAGDDFLAAPTDQRRYVRVSTSDIGAFELSATNPAAVLLSVVSRKTHGAAGTFDLPLTLDDRFSTEGRSGGANGEHTLIFNFAVPIDEVSGAAIVAGSANIMARGIGSDPRQYVVQLGAVPNAAKLTIALTSVSDVFGNSLGDVSTSAGFLIGDGNGDGNVNSADAILTRNLSGRASDGNSFRSDYNIDGTINAADAIIVRARSGDFIP